MLRSAASNLPVENAIVAIAMGLLLGALGLAAQAQRRSAVQQQTFNGTIAASSCSGPGGQTTTLQKGETFAHHTITCVKIGTQYVLFDPTSKTAYNLSDQKMPELFAGQNVVVIGTLDSDNGTIHEIDMVRALPPKVVQAKSVYIVCDACPRAMGKVHVAALQEMREWSRFDVLSDPAKADLIFLFSANPYLNDYLTRDGPDKRPVSVDTTYMDVIDTRTGASLWSGYRRWGSWRVSGATKDLISDLREQVEAGSSQLERSLFISRHHYSLGPADPTRVQDGGK